MGGGRPIGQQHTTAERVETMPVDGKERAPQLIVREHVQIAHRGRKLGWDSAVVYGLGGDRPQPVSAEATTHAQGRDVMKVALHFDGAGRCRVKTSFARYGAEGAAPQWVGRTRTVRWRTSDGQGVLLFPSELEVLANQLLGDKDELAGVTVAEFPDDLDEPVTFKEGFLLRRGLLPGERKGWVRLGKAGQEDYWFALYDEAGRCLRIDAGKVRKVPLPAATQPATATRAATTTQATRPSP
jgi:hypothetical protein